MHPFDEMKSYVGFNDADTEALRARWSLVEPRVDEVTERFYETLLRFPNAAAVMSSPQQVERLKGTLVVWMRELFCGPHDLEYFERRQRIGRTHVQVRLPQQYMFTAMNVLRTQVGEILIAGSSLQDALPGLRALTRICDLELAIMLGTYTTAREQGKLEELRDIIVTSLPLGVLVLDKDGRVTASTTGRGVWLVDGEPLGRLVHEAVVAPFGAELRERFEHARRTGHELVLPHVQLELPEGRRTLRASVIPVHHALASAIIHVEDMTDSLTFEARAKAAEHLAQLGTLAASIAHEIRNPLAGISGVVQVVALSLPDDDERKHALSRVQEQIGRLGGLIGELLMFSRPIQPSLTRLELRSVAEQAITAARAHAQQHGIDGTIDVDGGAVAVVDPTLCQQVLTNLIVNALQSGATTVRVEIGVGRVRVLDNGPGVPPELHKKIFEPFFTTKTRGTGLGLSIGRRMVESMHGTLMLCPSPLGGAGFEITLLRPDAVGRG